MTKRRGGTTAETIDKENERIKELVDSRSQRQGKENIRKVKKAAETEEIRNVHVRENVSKNRDNTR